MLVSLQSYTLLHFKRKQLLRWNVCQLSEDRNIRNIPSVTKGETHTNRLSFRLNKHKVSYFCLLHFYFQTAHTQEEEVPGWKSQRRLQRSSQSREGLGVGDIGLENCWNADTNPAWFPKISYADNKTQFPPTTLWDMIIQHAGRSCETFQKYYYSFSVAKSSEILSCLQTSLS